MAGPPITLRIRHVTGFRYDGRAVSSYNEVRMTPPDGSRQRVHDASLTVDPFAVQATYRDYFNTIVTTFDLHEPHDRLEVVADATVTTVTDDAPRLGASMAEVRAPSNVDRLTEYLTPTARTTLADATLEQLRDADLVHGDVDVVAESVTAWVRDRVAYVRGVTEVSSTAQEVWDQREGVCQDLTHVTVALLRSLGVPARYVSGYIHPRADAAIGETVVGESHSWVEYWGGAWRGIDPTNGGDIGQFHVEVAKGREYGDVPPLKGIYHGGSSSALGVVVEITRTA